MNDSVASERRAQMDKKGATKAQAARGMAVPYGSIERPPAACKVIEQKVDADRNLM